MHASYSLGYAAFEEYVQHYLTELKTEDWNSYDIHLSGSHGCGADGCGVVVWCVVWWVCV